MAGAGGLRLTRCYEELKGEIYSVWNQRDQKSVFQILPNLAERLSESFDLLIKDAHRKFGGLGCQTNVI